MAPQTPQPQAPQPPPQSQPLQPSSSLQVDTGADQSSSTFTLHNEDHTIGNTLRYVLNRSPEVSFVGYSVPHPSEPKMNIRIQTVGPPATEVLHTALGTLYEVSSHVLDTFEDAVVTYRAK